MSLIWLNKDSITISTEEAIISVGQTLTKVPPASARELYVTTDIPCDGFELKCSGLSSAFCDSQTNCLALSDSFKDDALIFSLLQL